MFRIPFDSNGSPIAITTPLDAWSILDLRVGRVVRLTGGPYAGDVAVVTGKNAAGHYSLRLSESINPTLKAKRRPFTLWLGAWWLNELCAGHCQALCPCVSIATEAASAEDEEEEGAKAAVGIAKYLRMSRIGMPMQAILSAMATDGLPKRTRDEYVQCGDMEGREMAREAALLGATAS
jgi:hypothetical protein